MIVVGELRDRRLAEQIVDECERRGIRLGLSELENDVLVILVERQEDHFPATQIYAYMTGRGEAMAQFERAQESQHQFIPPRKSTPLTFSLLIISGIASYGVYMDRTGWVSNFFYSVYKYPAFKEMMEGEIWRVITPIFLHFGVIHVLFNFMAMWDIGRLIELLHGRWFYGVFLLVTGMLSNTAQYVMVGPMFGGLSGVLFASLGFLWTYGAVIEERTFKLPKNSLVGVMIWFFLCLFGLGGMIANTAHGIGLTSGMLGAVVFALYQGNKIKILDLSKHLFFMSILTVITIGVDWWRFGGPFSWSN